MKTHILLVGNIQGAYRAQLLIKHLIDFRGHDDYLVDFALDAFYVPETVPETTLGKRLRRAYVVLLKFLSIIGIFFKLPFSDVVFILPLNHGWMPLVLIANLLWRRPIISDIYVSRYDTGQDWGLYTNPDGLRARYDRYLDRLMIEQSDAVIFSTTSDFESITKLVHADVTKARPIVLPLAVEKRAQATPIPSENFRLCWWGTWLPVHGLQNIIGAVKILRDRGVKLTLDLLGTATDEREPYVQLIATLGLTEWIHVHTDKTFMNGRLEEFVCNRCDLVVGMFGDSDKARHSLPNKILEGFSMNLPVITMKSTALSEFIDIENEIFVSDTQPGKIAETIIQIINDPAERARRAALGHKRFLTTFTPERLCRQVELVISKSIARHSAANFNI